MTNFSHLPKELVEEIMSWLPPNPLMRAKCVSKSWNALISAFLNNPEFVAKHIHNTKNKHSASIVFKSHDSDQLSLITLFDGDDCEGCIRSVTEDLCLPLVEEEGFLEACHCDGLICIVTDLWTIVLYNPAIYELELLPESTFKNFRAFCSSIGFGYDSRIKAYKLVRIFLGLHAVRAEVYTLGTDSWRDVSVSQDMSIYFTHVGPLYWRGVCYWMMYDCNDGNKKKILCFDMCNEEFHIMLGPNEIDSEADWMGLFEWNDSLALFSRSLRDSPSSSERDYEDLYPTIIQISVMDKYFGVEGAKGACSWSKSVNMTLPTGIKEALTIWKDDEFLMKDGHGQLVLYNLRTRKLRNITMHGVGRVRYWVCSYMKSLLLVNAR